MTIAYIGHVGFSGSVLTTHTGLLGQPFVYISCWTHSPLGHESGAGGLSWGHEIVFGVGSTATMAETIPEYGKIDCRIISELMVLVNSPVFILVFY